MQTKIEHIKYIYFLGIGGIGMSALARYFYHRGVKVEGYDRTKTALTQALVSEGIHIHYEDNPALIPTDTELVIYTPAVPKDLKEFIYLKDKGYSLLKRSEVLGLISDSKFCIAVAGSHGKTTTTSMIAHLLHAGNRGCLAFLGGISRNYNSNLIFDENAGIMVAEADEFDRSFLHLTPSLAVVTAIDPDHMDIYGNLDSLKSAFKEFILQIKHGGILLIKESLDLTYKLPENVSVYTYGFTETSDFHPVNIELKDGNYHFKVSTPFGLTKEFRLNVPGYINIENATAALSVCLLSGMQETELQTILPEYQGVVRRLDKRFEYAGQVYIDDYAHHPKELEACISSVRRMYPGKKLTGIFQPHLFTRTRDLADEFAECLSALDEIILLEIYPAREKPIPGITAEFLLKKIVNPAKMLISKEHLPEYLRKNDIQILLTLGAGDIDQLTEPIIAVLKQKNNLK